MNMKMILILLVVFPVAGCSNRAVYENIQINKKNECLALPKSEYEKCMQGVDKSYSEYERDRQEALKADERK